MTSIMNTLQQITEENLLDIEQAKAAGRSAIGFYCLYSPMEIAVAAGAIPLLPQLRKSCRAISAH